LKFVNALGVAVQLQQRRAEVVRDDGILVRESQNLAKFGDSLFKSFVSRLGHGGHDRKSALVPQHAFQNRAVAGVL
jgi:hypothetical protein